MNRREAFHGPRGHRGRGRRRRRVMQFLQPCLLLLLQRGEAHGYALMAEIEQFGFNPERVDPSLVYRALREMETAGWVRSEWDEEDTQGPKRRVYALEQEGYRQLELWIQDLRRTKLEIDQLLDAFEEQQQEGADHAEL
jgi:PadR family transcriptional regulator PadR